MSGNSAPPKPLFENRTSEQWLATPARLANKGRTRRFRPIPGHIRWYSSDLGIGEGTSFHRSPVR